MVVLKENVALEPDAGRLVENGPKPVRPSCTLQSESSVRKAAPASRYSPSVTTTARTARRISRPPVEHLVERQLLDALGRLVNGLLHHHYRVALFLGLARVGQLDGRDEAGRRAGGGKRRSSTRARAASLNSRSSRNSTFPRHHGDQGRHQAGRG